MRYWSVALPILLLALPVVIGCKKKDPPAPDPAAASAALTSVPVTGANTLPTAPPVMMPDEPPAIDAGVAGQRKRRTVKGQHAKE